jgi:hypothetical protein
MLTHASEIKRAVNAQGQEIVYIVTGAIFSCLA